ncbi:hypothetical protein CKM354_000997500 [Cercospora kikuchii]|uniref:NTF2-like domain-containing protein n=1 Tax=Cercospora kikuchii TaxID=84275 RepID=A0A9P3CSP7_9PEZI|nr:uncharacterized protein CKM354_000997500 [Cercospora kikuchii]GIZ46867.1 hypothetical protein CKM354_000997500 [Cercospora kikuchii]
MAIITAALLSLSLLVASATTHPTSSSIDPTCLTNEETQSIASKFVTLFTTDPSTGKISNGEDFVLTLVTPDFQWYSADSYVCSTPGKHDCHLVGPDQPLFDSRDRLIHSLKGTNESDAKTPYTNYQASVLHTFASCDEIAIRFEGTGKANSQAAAVTVPQDTPVKWQGTILLGINLASRLVKKSESSEDALTVLSQLGVKNVTEYFFQL